MLIEEVAMCTNKTLQSRNIYSTLPDLKMPNLSKIKIRCPFCLLDY